MKKKQCVDRLVRYDILFIISFFVVFIPFIFLLINQRS